jgi:hypothetical protein
MKIVKFLEYVSFLYCICLYVSGSQSAIDCFLLIAIHNKINLLKIKDLSIFQDTKTLIYALVQVIYLNTLFK